MNAQSKGGALLTEMESHVEAAEAAKAARSGSTEKKAARQAVALADLLTEADVPEGVDVETLVSTLTQTAELLGGKADEAVDFTDGNGIAEKVSALIAVGEDYQPTGFDAERAESLITRWKAATGRRSRGTGNGAGTPPSQIPPCPIRVVFTYPDGSDLKLSTDVTHTASWSSVSAEISKRALTLDGMERGDGYKRPESAKAMWREAVSSIKDGGDGGTVIVPTAKGDLIAEVMPVR